MVRPFSNEYVLKTYKREPAHTIPTVAKATVKAPVQTLLRTLLQTLPQPLEENQFSFSGLEDRESSVDPEDFGKGGVEVESAYDLELRIGKGLGHSSLLTVPNKEVRW